MITTVSLVNIHPSSISYRNEKKKQKCFFLVMRTVRSHSFHNLPVYQTAGVKYNHYVVHYIPGTLSDNWKLCLWTTFLRPFPIHLISFSMSLFFSQLHSLM